MAIEREQVGEVEMYHGRRLYARHMGPDVLGFVDDMELGGFFLSPQAARDAGKRHVDAELRAAADAERKGKRA